MTLRRVSSDTLAPGVKARETADCETPAARATSVDVTCVRAILVPDIIDCEGFCAGPRAVRKGGTDSLAPQITSSTDNPINREF